MAKAERRGLGDLMQAPLLFGSSFTTWLLALGTVWGQVWNE